MYSTSKQVMPRNSVAVDGAVREEGGSNAAGRYLPFPGSSSSSRTTSTEARDGDISTLGPSRETFAHVGSVASTVEEQQGQHQYTDRKPFISVVDGYNSQVRRGDGSQSHIEVFEEATAEVLASGLDGSRNESCGIFQHHHGSTENGGHHHDHCVIARRETEQAEHPSNKVRFAVHASILANVFLSIAFAFSAYRSGSLAVLASLVDTLLDLVSQVVLSVAEKCMRKPSDEHYPAGRSRIEPVGVIIVSVIMGVAALELLRASVSTMIMALGYRKLPVLDMEPITIGIMVVAVGVKVSLYLYSSTLAGSSGTAEALAEDHKNDIMTNSFSVISSTVAHYFPKAWFVDPVGAIVISCLIFYNWFHVGKDHASKIIGRSAPTETLETITELAGQHHAQLGLDIIRAYHFGPNFLVELEVVLPRDMSVEEAHDIALGLQQKVERQSFVERCFVHVDYRTRGYNEHKV